MKVYINCQGHMTNMATKAVRGMAGKFVDTSAIRKSNAFLKKRFA